MNVARSTDAPPPTRRPWRPAKSTPASPHGEPPGQTNPAIISPARIAMLPPEIAMT
jgi:hypothetical protein